VVNALNPLRTSPHRLKLAVFGVNVSGGCSMTRAPGTIEVSWEESKRIAMMADAADFDALVPGLAAVTSRIALFSTCHVPTVHPVRVAKEFSTIDHISGGRFCLNIVAGWNEREISMFGAPQAAHDIRYDIADDWISLIKALWSREEEFDWNGPHFTVPAAYSQPKPLQSTPVVMSAGNSPRGQAFAAKHADLNFVVAPEGVRSQAGALGRQVQVFGQCYVVCRDTEAEAKAFVERYVNELGDWAGVRNLLDVLIPNSQSALGSEWEAMAANMIAGYGALPLVGTPDQIVEGLARISAAGLDGTTLSWVDYEAGIEQFERVLKPRLIEAGLREKL
jgi:alkanesulfonate monooxygenase SsuD/methylene tetrahydromethanopterin reductase-like flavin-dependent oxidoreductase (luciferase family)